MKRFIGKIIDKLMKIVKLKANPNKYIKINLRFAFIILTEIYSSKLLIYEAFQPTRSVVVLHKSLFGF